MTGFLIPKKILYTGFQCSATILAGTADMPITCSLGVIDSAMDTDLTGNPTLLHLESGSRISDDGGTNYDTLQISSSTEQAIEIPANSMVYPKFKWGTDQSASNISGNSADLSIVLQFRYKLIK